MQMKFSKSIYLILIVLVGALLLSFAGLDPDTASEIKPDRSTDTKTPEMFTEDQRLVKEDGKLTTDEPVITGELQETTQATRRVTEESAVRTPEPVVTTAVPVIKTVEPEITAGRLEGIAGASGRAQEFGVDGSSNPDVNSSDSDVTNSPVECNWQITFEDNFEGDEIKTELWDTGYKAGVHEAQYYVEDAFELEGGILKIRAEERQVNDRKYASGILTTQGIFDQTYGLFQVRAKVPAGQGLWPAFWLLPSSENYPLEIDVFEILGHEPDTVYMSNHWRDDSDRTTFHTRGFKGPDFSREFHVFEIMWKTDEIIWAVDGVERSRETRGIPDEPMFLLLNLAVGGKWPGYPDDSTPFPSYLEVDYVRVYEWACPEDILKYSD